MMKIWQKISLEEIKMVIGVKTTKINGRTFFADTLEFAVLYDKKPNKTAKACYLKSKQCTTDVDILDKLNNLEEDFGYNPNNNTEYYFGSGLMDGKMFQNFQADRAFKAFNKGYRLQGFDAYNKMMARASSTKDGTSLVFLKDLIALETEVSNFLKEQEKTLIQAPKETSNLDL